MMGSAAPALTPDQQAERDRIEKILEGDEVHIERLYRHYVSNLLKNTSPSKRSAFRFISALEQNVQITELDGKPVKFPAKKPLKSSDWVYTLDRIDTLEINPADWDVVNRFFADKDLGIETACADARYINLMKLADILALSELERDLLQLLFTMQASDEFGDIMNSFMSDDRMKAAAAFALMLDRPYETNAIARIINVDSRLAMYGIVKVDGDDISSRPEISNYLLASFEDLAMTEAEVKEAVVGKTRTTELTLDDFSYLGGQVDFAVSLIREAVAKGEKGINILLYGPPGSGKTELAAALAKHLELSIYAAGEDKRDATRYEPEASGDAQASRERIMRLLRTQALLEGNRDAIILFDEVEDIILKGTDSTKSADTESKIKTNRLLEDNPVVTIWTGNNPEKFHDAVRQRFTYSIYMDYPPTLIRKKIWQRRLDLEKVKIPDADVLNLARNFTVPPRMITKAVRTMRIVGGDSRIIRDSLRADLKLSGAQQGADEANSPIPQGLDLSCLNAEQNLTDIFNRLVERGRTQKCFGLYMNGARGTGAEPLLHLLGEEMIAHVHEYTGAELVTSTMTSPAAEKIAQAFAHAADSRALLVVKDFEGFLNEPETPEKPSNWTSSVVSLFVHKASEYRGAFAVTTSERIDLLKIPQMKMLFSDNISLKPLAAAQVRGIVRARTGLDLNGDVDGVVYNDLLQAFNWSEKYGPVSPERMAELIAGYGALRAARPSAIGFNCG